MLLPLPLLLLLAALAEATTTIPPLLPSVRSLEPRDGADIDVSVARVTTASGSSSPAQVLELAGRVQAELGPVAAAGGLEIELRLAPGHLGEDTATDVHGAIAGPESYELVLARGGANNHTIMTIEASGPAGLFYGTLTAMQLVHGARRRGGMLPPLRIIDAPVSSYRGVMVDNVRNAHNASFHMAFLDKLAAAKMNVYQLHASDDQGYSLPSIAFPQLPSSKLAMTAAEAKALQVKATLLHINIVAEIDLPGHSSGLLKALPALAAKSNKTGKPCHTIDVQSSKALAIMQTLVAENIALFPSPLGLYHLGAGKPQTTI
jgi:hexosaminidase